VQPASELCRRTDKVERIGEPVSRVPSHRESNNHRPKKSFPSFIWRNFEKDTVAKDFSSSGPPTEVCVNIVVNDESWEKEPEDAFMRHLGRVQHLRTYDNQHNYGPHQVSELVANHLGPEGQN